MKCPVCRHLIPILAEHCDHCGSDWVEGQEHCPAVLDFYGAKLQCNLDFRHFDQNVKKHRITGYPYGSEIELTVSWIYPETAEYAHRSNDIRRQREGHSR